MAEIFEKASVFAKEHIEPVAVEMDKKKEFPTGVFEKLHEEGYLKLIIPEELGGQGGDIVEHAEAIRAFSEYSATVGLTYMMHNVALNVVLNAAHDEMKNQVVKEVIEEGKFLALAYSESTGGVEFYYPDTTRAEKDGAQWIINGSKSMVTSATHASYYMVVAKTGEGQADADNFIISKDDDGVSFKMEYWNGLGMRGNVSCPMYMEDVRLAEDRRTGEEGSAMEQILTLVAPLFVEGLAAVYSGLNKAIANEAIMHAMDREFPDGHKLSEVDAIKKHISKIYNNALAGAAVTKEAAYAARAGAEDALPKILAARVVAIENVTEAANLGMRIGGGRSYNGYRNFEQYLRDALAGQVMAPSLDILHQWIGAALTGQQIP